MEASEAPDFTLKSNQHLLQMLPAPSWRRYESEEEDVSETSSQSVFSPTEGEAGSYDEDDVDEFASDAEAEMLSSSRLVSSDDSSSLYTNRLSIITAKRSSAATYVPQYHGQDDDDDVSPCTEYMTPPLSPLYLSPVCYLPEMSGDRPRKEPILANDAHEDVAHDFEWHEVFEAKQVVFTAPTSRPSIVTIPSPTTETILSARMGDPTYKADGKNNSLDSPITAGKRPSAKRSSSASGMSLVDHPKRYSAMFCRDLTKSGEIAYVDSRNHLRTRSSQCHARGRSRPRADAPLKVRSDSRDVNCSELRQLRPRRNPSQRSSTSNRYTPDHETRRNYSRPRSIRSSSVASNATTTSSVSSKPFHSHNWSSTSLQRSRSPSVEARECSSSPRSSSLQNETDTPKPTPHPLSIITTPTSPVTSSNPDHAKLTSHAHSGLASYSEVERKNTSSTNPSTFPYSRPRNLSLSLSLATAPEDLEPAVTRSRMRKNSSTSSPIFTRKLSMSTSGLAPASSKAQSHATSSPIKLLMGGFRGLGKQRTRS